MKYFWGKFYPENLFDVGTIIVSIIIAVLLVGLLNMIF